jgi:hypothetical protein
MALAAVDATAQDCGTGVGEGSRAILIGGGAMVAKVGDRIIVESERVGQADRRGEILEIIPHDYGTEYRVKWEDGHESSIRPAAGSVRTEPAPRRPVRA